jgi:opacity protein-like surface antigen
MYARHMLLLALLVASAPLAAQDTTKTPESEAEARARIARRTAGLTVGHWDLRGIDPAPTVDVSTMPLIGGFLRKGLDARLSLENSIGVWRRVQSVEATGGIGGTPAEEVQSWVIAQTTALRFFPATDAGARFEPWVLGGAGFTVGVDDRETEGGGLLGGSAGGAGVQLIPGFSLQGGAGVEWWFAQSFALNVGARYQWTRFLQDFGGERTYQGPVYEAGITYKFRYN